MSKLTPTLESKASICVCTILLLNIPPLVSCVLWSFFHPYLQLPRPSYHLAETWLAGTMEELDVNASKIKEGQGKPMVMAAENQDEDPYTSKSKKKINFSDYLVVHPLQTFVLMLIVCSEGFLI